MNPLGVHEVLRYMKRIPGYSDIDMFIETGTGRCGTTFQMCAVFDRVMTIEASPKLFGLMERVYRTTKVEFRFGESHKVLNEMVQNEVGRDSAIVFFLDAHWYKSKSGDTIYSKAPTPLIQELEVIYPRPYADLIIIDDSRLFGEQKNGLDWKHVTEESILTAIGEDTVCDSYEENDRYLIFRNPGVRKHRPKLEISVEQKMQNVRKQKVGEFF